MFPFSDKYSTNKSLKMSIFLLRVAKNIKNNAFVDVLTDPIERSDVETIKSKNER